MNNTWLAFMTLLLVALIAVALGAQQMDTQRAQEISMLKAQVDEVARVALEFQEQRDEALVARDEATVKVDGLNAEIAALRDDVRNEHGVADNRQQEIDRLVIENGELRVQVQILQVKTVELESQVSNVTLVSKPVTGNQNAVADDTNELCLPLETQNLPDQLGLGLVVLIGLAALGSGGYLYYHHDPNRKYPVKMTREQIKEYARYQRERGNQAG